ncbi:MAG: MTH938/NDUFAF3 family protein [Firmicutes bacterium]|nr:MTH938/NDUFAF3 family protein [Bacillota bacterium]
MKIESCSFGKIVIDGKTYQNDLIIFSDHLNASWRRKESHKLCLADIFEIIKEGPEVIVIGTGESGLMRVLTEVKENLKDKGIELVVAPTEQACKAYNDMSKSKKTIAALHITC